MPEADTALTAVFAGAAELSDPAAHVAYLNDACRENASLRLQAEGAARKGTGQSLRNAGSQELDQEPIMRFGTVGSWSRRTCVAHDINAITPQFRSNQGTIALRINSSYTQCTNANLSIAQWERNTWYSHRGYEVICQNIRSLSHQVRGVELWDDGTRCTGCVRHRRDQLFSQVGRVSEDLILNLDEPAVGKLHTSVLHFSEAVPLMAVWSKAIYLRLVDASSRMIRRAKRALKPTWLRSSRGWAWISTCSNRQSRNCSESLADDLVHLSTPGRERTR